MREHRAHAGRILGGMWRRALPFLLLAAFARADGHPLAKDKTGLNWTLPFKAALAKAKAEKRLLLVKPVAFGTSPDGGW